MPVSWTARLGRDFGRLLLSESDVITIQTDDIFFGIFVTLNLHKNESGVLSKANFDNFVAFNLQKNPPIAWLALALLEENRCAHCV